MEIGSLTSPERWKKEGRTFLHRGHEIFYREEGRGEPLLLIHGFPTSSFDWIYVWPELAKRYRLVAADLIGFGFSAKPARYDYSIPDQADLLEGLLSELAIPRYGILAHDYGDTVAQELLARASERSTSDQGPTFCVLLNGGLFPESHHPRFVQKLLISPIGGLVTRLITERTFRKNFSEIFGEQTKPSEEELRCFWEIMNHNNGVRIYHRLIRYMQERRKQRTRWVGPLINSPIPLALINGPVDPVSGAHMVQRYRELVTTKHIYELDGIGHYPQTEAPERMLKSFLDFVADL